MAKRKNSKILVVKLGTRVLTSHKTNRLDEARIKNIVAQISNLADKGYKILIVSSGAIGAGMGVLGLKSRPQSLPKLQACAAIGQSELMKIYSGFFKSKRCLVAQILLTQDDFNSKERYLNAKNTLIALLESGVVPIINENDTVSTDEIKLGDNDRLSSLVACMVGANKLVIFTDVDNLYKYDSHHKKRTAIPNVEKVTKEIEALAGGTSGKVGLGGMITKIQAAKTATESNIACHFVNGTTKNVLLKIEEGKKIGTLFEPCASCLGEKKQWIKSTSKKGSLAVDKGAKEALVERNKSLLSSGIVRVEGNFNIGDTVGVCDNKGEEFARGRVNYNSKEVDKIKGLKTNQIDQVLGYKHYDEVVHRDNLVIL